MVYGTGEGNSLERFDKLASIDSIYDGIIEEEVLTIFQPFGIDDLLPSQIVGHSLSQALIVFCVTSFISLLLT